MSDAAQSQGSPLRPALLVAVILLVVGGTLAAVARSGSPQDPAEGGTPAPPTGSAVETAPEWARSTAMPAPSDPVPTPLDPVPTPLDPAPTPTDPVPTPPPPSGTPTPTAPAAAPPPPALPGEPDALAMVLADAESSIRDPATPADHVEGWARLAQQAYRMLVDRPEWQVQVGEAIPAELRTAFDANLRAGLALAELNSPRDELPSWRIVPPPPAEELLAAYRSAAEERGLDWTYLAAIHLVETRLGRIEGTSHAGAQGPMQFMPATWEAYGEGSVHDTRDAIRAAAFYLQDHGAPADMPSAIWHYNHSDLYVEAIQAYASVIRTDEAAFRGYYHWQVYYAHVDGDLLLEEGWAHP